MLALMSSFSVVKKSTPFSFNQDWNLRLINSVPLSVWSRAGGGSGMDWKAFKIVGLFYILDETSVFLVKSSLQLESFCLFQLILSSFLTNFLQYFQKVTKTRIF